MMKINRPATGWQLRIIIVALLVLSLVGVVVGAAYSALGPNKSANLSESSGGKLSSESPIEDTYQVTVDTSEIRLACPPGAFDPEREDTQLRSANTWVSTSVSPVELTGGGTFIDPGVITGVQDFPSGFSVAGQDSGDWYSLLIDSCQITNNKIGLVAGATSVGEDSILILSNPNNKPVEVNIEGFSNTGSLGKVTQKITIAPQSTMTWRPAIWFSGQERLGLLLETDGLGIAAWLQTSGRDGEVSNGLGRVAARSLSTDNIFVGIDEDGGTPTLNLLNPTEEMLAISVQVSDSEGTSVLGGTEDLVLDPGAVSRVDLKGIGTTPVTIITSADKPFSASVSYPRIGNADPVVVDSKTNSRTLVASNQLAETITLPVKALTEKAADLGYENLEATLVIANNSKQDATISLNGVSSASETEQSGTVDGTVSIKAGSTVVLSAEELGNAAELIISDVPVAASLVISGQTKQGIVESNVDLGTGSFDAVTTEIQVGP